jgi:LEA14-like dessication related protein
MKRVFFAWGYPGRENRYHSYKLLWSLSAIFFFFLSMKDMRKLLVFLGVFILLTACKSTSHQGPPTATEVREPTFTITSIKILQADLINTRLKLTFKVDNPNIFPITLSSFRYELYGDGYLWANGVEKDLAAVPAEGFAETSLNFEMNFIGMKRRLLDDIIAMREVHYRVTGSMELGTGIPSLPGFRINFDYSGNSAVLQ